MHTSFSASCWDEVFISVILCTWKKERKRCLLNVRVKYINIDCTDVHSVHLFLDYALQRSQNAALNMHNPQQFCSMQSSFKVKWNAWKKMNLRCFFFFFMNHIEPLILSPIGGWKQNLFHSQNMFEADLLACILRIIFIYLIFGEKGEQSHIFSSCSPAQVCTISDGLIILSEHTHQHAPLSLPGPWSFISHLCDYICYSSTPFFFLLYFNLMCVHSCGRMCVCLCVGVRSSRLHFFPLLLWNKSQLASSSKRCSHSTTRIILRYARTVAAEKVKTLLVIKLEHEAGDNSELHLVPPKQRKRFHYLLRLSTEFRGKRDRNAAFSEK